MTDLTELGRKLHATATDKGFWPEPGKRNPDVYVAKLMMVTTEVAEIVEAYRKQQGMNRIEEEFADLLIRILDLYEGMYEESLVESDLTEVVLKKAKINTQRDRLHGNLI